MFSLLSLINLLSAEPIFSNTSLYCGNSFPWYKKNTDMDFSCCCKCSCRAFFCRRYASRISLLIRLRSTAFLKFLLLTPTPACNTACSFFNIHITRKGKLEKLLPCAKSCSIAFRLLSLSSFLKWYRILFSSECKIKKAPVDKRKLL